MIHVGVDVHIRNSVLNAKDEDGQVLARGRCGNTMLELSGFFAPLERRSKATGESIRVVMEGTGNSRAIQRLLTQFGQEAGIDQLDESIKQSTACLCTVMREPRWSKPAALLQTMPGIGLITSLMILAELGNLSRFRSRAAVANYAGLVPRRRDSNDKRWSGHITRRGSAHLRGVLIEAAWMAAPRVPVYQALFDRVALKKNKKTAIVAVARRMLEDAWMLLIKDEAFRYVPAFLGDAQEDRTRTPAGPEHRELRSRVPQAASSVAG